MLLTYCKWWISCCNWYWELVYRYSYDTSAVPLYIHIGIPRNRTNLSRLIIRREKTTPKHLRSESMNKWVCENLHIQLRSWKLQIVLRRRRWWNDGNWLHVRPDNPGTTPHIVGLAMMVSPIWGWWRVCWQVGGIRTAGRARWGDGWGRERECIEIWGRVQWGKRVKDGDRQEKISHICYKITIF